MKIFFKILSLGVFSSVVISCGVNRVYPSASYGALKTYTEKPIYNGEKEVATYISGSFRNTKYPQDVGVDEMVDDEVIGGNLSIYRVITNKKFNYYYGLGTSFGSYNFNSELKNFNNDSGNLINENDKLNYYNVNLKTGINLTKTLEKFEYSIIGLELIYVNEFGPYMDKLESLVPQVRSDVLIADEKSIFAFNLNTEITFRINNTNNLGAGIFFGSVLFNDKEKIEDETALISGIILKYNYKDFTLSFISENSTRNISSARFGITYKLISKIKKKPNNDLKTP